MPSSLALLVWFVLLVTLLRIEARLQPAASPALWLPVLWIFIVGSRLPSQWLGGGVGYGNLDEGNSFDRLVYLLLIFGALMILMRRSFEWGAFVASNKLLSLFLGYSLISVLWSDFPLVAFKRWFRDFGLYLALLVAASDPRVAEGAARVLRRVLFLAVPLSIILNKYFEHLAREYDHWTGRGYLIGVTTSKNMLGVLCLVSSLYFFWDLLSRWHARAEPRVKRIIHIDILLLAMSVLLLFDADSATSKLCLAIGCLVLAAAHLGIVQRHPRLLTVPIPIFIASYAVLEFVFDVNLMAIVAEAVGRSPDLTGRTHIWSVVLSTNTNPLFGTGYESFWLGPRRDYVWQLAGPLTHSHNGYLETYLNLGFVGLGLILAFLLASYAAICRGFQTSPREASFALALWTILLYYNITEAALRGNFVWTVFVLFVLAVPRREATFARLVDAPLGSSRTASPALHPPSPTRSSRAMRASSNP